MKKMKKLALVALLSDAPQPAKKKRKRFFRVYLHSGKWTDPKTKEAIRYKYQTRVSCCRVPHPGEARLEVWDCRSTPWKLVTRKEFQK